MAASTLSRLPIRALRMDPGTIVAITGRLRKARSPRRIGKGYVKALSRQPPVQAADMVLVACFDDAVDGDGADIFTGEGAVVGNVAHTCAFVGNHCGKAGKTAWSITDDGGEAAKPSIRRQAAF